MRIKEDLKEDPNNLRITSAVNVEEHGTETPPQELPVPDAHAGVSDSTKEKVDEIEEFVLLPPPANKMYVVSYAWLKKGRAARLT